VDEHEQHVERQLGEWNLTFLARDMLLSNVNTQITDAINSYREIRRYGNGSTHPDLKPWLPRSKPMTGLPYDCSAACVSFFWQIPLPRSARKLVDQGAGPRRPSSARVGLFCLPTEYITT
jgi:hypothetical protein